MPLLNPPRKPGSVPEGDPQLLNPEHPARNRQGTNAPQPPQPIPSQGGDDDDGSGGGSEFDIEDPEAGEDQFFLTYDEDADEGVWTELHREATFDVTLTGLVSGKTYVVAIEHSNIGSFGKLYKCRVVPDCTLTKIALSEAVQGDDDTLYLLMILGGDLGETEVVLTITLEGFFFTAGGGGAASGAATVLQAGYAEFVRLSGSTMTGPIFWPIDTPAQLTANANDYAIGNGRFQRLSSDASRNITGIVATQGGDERTLANIGAQDIVLTNLDAASAAANQIRTSTGASLTLLPQGTAVIWYDPTSAVWRARLQ